MKARAQARYERMRRKRARGILLAVTVAVAASSVTPSDSAPGTIARESVASGGVQANGPTPAASVPDTTSPDMSLDGRWIVFSSDATNLVPGDTNGVADVFLRDLKTGATSRVSVTSTKAQANGASYSPSLSVDGRRLAFASRATNLVTGDTNGVADVFLRDLKTGSTTRLSVATGGAQANGESNSPFVSLFGEWVTFESEATNLSSGDTNGVSDAFLRDVGAKKTTRIAPPAMAADLPQPETTWTSHARISYEGRYIAYQRTATRAGWDSPSASDVFFLDRVSGRSTQIKVDPWAGTAKVMSQNPVISADGRYVAFDAYSVVTESDTIANNDVLRNSRETVAVDDALVRNPFDPRDVMMYDRVNKTLQPLSSNPAGPVADGDSYDPRISADGRVIAFSSDATNLAAGDTNGSTDVFVRDLGARITSRVSVPSGFGESSGASHRPSMSYEGRQVVFASTGRDLVPADTNNTADVFRRDRQTSTTNRAPKMVQLSSALRGMDIADTARLTLRASDADKDPLRFGIIIATDKDAGGVPLQGDYSIDPKTGSFAWQPSPSQMGHQVEFVFWVQDPRGFSDFALARYYVRDAQQTVRCRAQGNACYP